MTEAARIAADLKLNIEPMKMSVPQATHTRKVDRSH